MAAKQGILLVRIARLVAASVVHSFSSDQLRLRVGGLLSSRNVSEGRGELSSRMRQLSQRISKSHREPIAGRLCDTVGGIMMMELGLDAVPPDGEGTLYAE